jgi:hypothetical protein
MVGGALAEPAKTMPTWFGDTMFDRFPYLLPSLVTAILPAFTAVAAYIWMPEVSSPHVVEANRADITDPRPTRR